MSSVYGSAIFVASVLAAGVASALQKSKTKPRSTPCHPLSTMGALYNPEFLSIVAPLYDMHMGCENMGPMLYALVRFLKPRKVLEIGAGYTSIFLLQALADNEEEERRWAEERSSNSCTCEGVDWSVDAYFARRSTRPPPVLDVVDNMEHEATTAHLVLSAAKELKIESYLKVHVADAYDLNASSFDGQFDLVWLDGISTDERFAGLFKTYWELIKDGGYAAVHSTLTNNLSKAWLSKVHAEKKAEEATCVARFEVKPWDGDADLSLLKDKVRGHDLDNLAQVTWLERSLVEEVGYGIKKLILFARIDEAAGASAEVVADYLSETFEEEIQSVDVELGDDADAGASWGNFSVFGFLEPHKTRQNSFSLFQKRGLTYAEPSYSWTP